MRVKRVRPDLAYNWKAQGKLQMVKKYNDFDPQLESAVLTDKAKLSLYKKSVNSGIPANILEEVYQRGVNTWNSTFGYSPEQFGFDRVNSFISGGFAAQLDEDLRNWFNPKHPEGGWKRINTKGEVVGPCAREEGEPKPKCMSNEKISQLSKKERAAAVAAKRRHDPVADRPGKGGKPINVSNYGKGKISEEFLEEKNEPTNPSLWSKAKSLARSKFDVYPSAYANGWAAKWYKSKGGGWKSVSEENIEEKCWDGYKQVGMKKKGDRMVPNCVPVKEADAEAHSKNMDKPSSRFIGSNELVDIYKQQTPGQIIKKVVREHLDEVAMYMPPDIQPPSITRPAPQRQFSRSVTTSGRMGSGAGAMRGGVQIQRAAPYSGPTARMAGQGGTMKVSSTNVGPRAPAPRPISSTMGSGAGAGSSPALNAKPTVTRGMEASKFSIQKGMTAAGREAAEKTASKVVPAAAEKVAGGVLGKVAKTALGPAAGAAMAVMEPTPAGEKMSEFERQDVMKKYNPFKSQGRSISQYEKDVLTPKASETPKAEAPRPKADVPTPPSRPEYFTRGQAFGAARSEIGGSGGKFEYGGKEYQTNVKGEPYVAKPKTTSVTDTESGIRKKIKEAIQEATYKGKKVPLNKPMKGDVKKSKVFVDPDGDGKAQKVNFGDKNLSIKKHIPARKKSYCARSGGQGNLTDKTSANYWSRKAWNCEEIEVNELSVPAGTTGKRKEVSTPMVAIRMASGKIEKHPPGKSGSSGGGDE